MILRRGRVALHLVLCAVFTILFVVGTVRLALAGAWLEGLPVPFMALGFGWYTRRRYRQFVTRRS